MPFTDEDLKQTREFMADDIAIGTPKLQRLLARLEAAEHFIDSSVTLYGIGEDCQKDYEAWRKAAGK